MDPRKLFNDERLTGRCVYCGSDDDTGDHVPSKILLDEPFPENLPKVPACWNCNNSLAPHEDYLACFIDCVIAGTTDPSKVARTKVRRVLEHSPALRALIEATRSVHPSGTTTWSPDMDLVTKVVMKHARGHVAHWLATPEYDEPQLKIVTPLEGLPEAARREFETLPEESVWPEIGSRAFLESVVVLTGSLDQSVYLPSGWNIVQPDRYRYAVSYSKRIEARIVLSEYLACLVAW